MSSVFANALLEEILSNRSNHHTDNFDPMMQYDACYKETKPSYFPLMDKVIPLGYQVKKRRHFLNLLNPSAFYKAIIKNFEDMSVLYDLLKDKASKALLVKIIAYKILGHLKIKLPRNNAKYWHDIQAMKNLEEGHNDLQINFLNLNLPFLDLAPLGYQIKVNVTHAGAAAIFAQKQYEYHGENFTIKADKDDIVLDCGACWGETALYFAHEVGAGGKVYAFEFIPENVNIFNTNINHNPELKKQIELVQHPVWHQSDEDLFYADNGPGSSISTTLGTHSQACKTIAIDDFVNRNHVNKVDLIKMDIEGAEMNALMGAKETIKKFRPKLALSVYHKPDDFVTIPAFIKSLDVDYDFYLDHHTIHFWETILYARPKYPI